MWNLKRWVAFREIILDTQSECCRAMDTWKGDVNFYNPCNQLTFDELNTIRTKAGDNFIWCGD